MKRLSLMVALSALAVAGFAKTAYAAELQGTVLVQDTGFRDYPAGVTETGRFGRFIIDPRLSDVEFTNRDFEDWKELGPSAHNKMNHYLRGDLSQESRGRFALGIIDPRTTDLTFENRDFEAYKEPSGTAKFQFGSHLRGLGSATIYPHRRIASRVYVNIPVSYF